MNFALISPWHVHTKNFMEKITKKGADCLYIWDFDHTRGKAAAELYQAVFEADYRKILADPAVEAVVVEAPTAMHKELIVLAAQAGKHIFSDKKRQMKRFKFHLPFYQSIVTVGGICPL